MAQPKELVELDVEFKYSTPDAILVTNGEHPDAAAYREYWIPKKFVENWDTDFIPQIGKAISIEIPEWLAEKKEML